MPVLAAPSAPTHELAGARFTALATPTGQHRHQRLAGGDRPGHAGHPALGDPEEVFVVLEGTARVRLGESEQLAGPGAAIVVPARRAVRAGRGGPVPLRAMCLLPVGGQAQLPGGEPFTPPWAR